MILFFFMLLMLAMAGGVVDHFQSIVSNAPPPKQAPFTLEAAHGHSPPIVPPAIAPAPAPDKDSADDASAPRAAAYDPAGQANAVNKTGEKP